jgi:hypothetical protein
MKRRNYERMSRAKSQEKYSLPIGPLRPIPTLLACIPFTYMTEQLEATIQYAYFNE